MRLSSSHSAPLEALVLASSLFASSYALVLPISGRVLRRGSMSGHASLSDSGLIQYSANLTLNGKQYSALIDTGSSDLFVVQTVPGAQDTGKTGGVSYVGDNVKGPIRTADLNFLGYNVKDQAFLEIPPDSTHKSGTGLIGLGPHVGSTIWSQFNSAKGDPPLDRIFAQNRSSANFLSIALGRSGDSFAKSTVQAFPGDITISETLDGKDAIHSQKQLSVAEMAAGSGGNQHWSTLLDFAGIVGPDGSVITYNSTVQTSADLNRATVMFDTGFTFPQVPRAIADAIYGSIPGAQYSDNCPGLAGPGYILPCNAEVNVSFVFGGQTIPIHPLDMNMDNAEVQGQGTPGQTCFGAFQPAEPLKGVVDMILGMAFLRNTYLLVNFGDFVDGSNSKTADPFIQLLAQVTDPASAHNDFVQTRLGGVDSTTQLWPLGQAASTPPSEPSPRPADSGFNGSQIDLANFFTGKNGKRNTIIIAASVGGGVLLMILCCVCGACRRRSKRAAGNSYQSGSYVPANWSSSRGAYRPLHDPAPMGQSGHASRPSVGSHQPYEYRR